MDEFCIVSKKKVILASVLFLLGFICIFLSILSDIFILPCVLFLASAFFISLVHLRCSNCGAYFKFSWKYCSRCGAMIKYR